MTGKPGINNIGVEMVCDAFRHGRYLLSGSREPMHVKETEVSDTWLVRPVDPGIGAFDDTSMSCFMFGKPGFKFCRSK